jgi:hypothetical protein
MAQRGEYQEALSGGLQWSKVMTDEQKELMIAEFEKAVAADKLTEEMERMCRLRNMKERDKLQAIKREQRKQRKRK